MAEKAKQALEKEITNLKSKSNAPIEFPSKKLDELKEQNRELEDTLKEQRKSFSELTGKYENLEEEHVLFKAQLTTQKEYLESKINSLLNKVKDYESLETKWKKDSADLTKKITDLQKKLTIAEHKDIKTGTSEMEKARLKAKLEEKQSEYDNLLNQNEMNLDQLANLKRDYDELKRKMDDFDRINKAQRTLSDHNAALENELKNLRTK